MIEVQPNMDDPLQKYIVLVPLTLNDGTPVAAETIYGTPRICEAGSRVAGYLG